jgi:hypothetical protein
MGVGLGQLHRRHLLTMAATACRAVQIGGQVPVYPAARGTVHSVFARALNCTVGGQLWTLLAADAPDGPYGVRLEPGVLPGALGAHPGDPVSVRAGFVSAGPAVVDCRGAPRWVPRPAAPLGDGWAARMETVAALAAPRAWPGSAALAGRLADALDQPPGAGAVQQAVDEAIGRGIGLTPSGDDVLAGLLAALWWAAPGTERPAGPGAGRALAAGSRLASGWARTRSRTTDLSRHLLDQACRGLFGAALHGLLRAVGAEAEAEADLPGAVDVMLGLGATSGADTCTGVAAAGRLLARSSQEGIRA